MKFLEDYIPKALLDDLEKAIRKVDDDDEFVQCILSLLGNEVNAQKMLSYLENSKLKYEERTKIIDYVLYLEHGY